MRMKMSIANELLTTCGSAISTSASTTRAAIFSDEPDISALSRRQGRSA